MRNRDHCLRMCELLMNSGIPDLPAPEGSYTKFGQDGRKPDGFDMAHCFSEHSCGTSACVLGWANWFGSQVSEIDFDYEWVYSARWAKVGVHGLKAAVHRMYYEIAYGPPPFEVVRGVMQDWASFVEAWPFETCRKDAYTDRGREADKG